MRSPGGNGRIVQGSLRPPARSEGRRIPARGGNEEAGVVSREDVIFARPGLDSRATILEMYEFGHLSFRWDEGCEGTRTNLGTLKVWVTV